MAAVIFKDTGVCIKNGVPVESGITGDREKTMAYKILRAHSKGGAQGLRIKFDALISHDITYVGVIQTARASGMREFPVPYAMTNCHNSLCAVGGTINEDDHAFGLSAAKKYGGIYVPANQAVIHQFAREMLVSCGSMILGSDSHTRYGCCGTMGVGEGGGELVKQLLGNTWDIPAPETVLVWLEGTPRRGTGPHDAALSLVKELFPDGKVKNRILEFAGPGVSGLSMDFRMGIDVMTTETGCLSSIWETDETVRRYYETLGRPGAYSRLSPEDGAYYDAMVTVNLNELESMIALPFHPSRAYTVHEVQRDARNIFAAVEKECAEQLGGDIKLDLQSSIMPDGRVRAEQGVIVGCAGGTYENICEAAAILEGKSVGNGYFDLSVYPSSSPIGLAVMKNGVAARLTEAGAVMKPAFCGPCFGAGDTPANGTLSFRHATRNFASREGSRPSAGQMTAVALMDSRSIAATAANGGVLTAATDIEYDFTPPEYTYSGGIYEKRCWFGYGKPKPDTQLRFGPNITDWPEMYPLGDNLLIKLCAVIRDDVTTTDELIPSGETSSYRSNPTALAEFTLSRRVPEYVARAKSVRTLAERIRGGETPEEIAKTLKLAGEFSGDVTVGSCIFANRPGDGSAREQAASCQRVLGGAANVCIEYATKRYRSNCINWGLLPFTANEHDAALMNEGDWIFVPEVRSTVLSGGSIFGAKLISGGTAYELELKCEGLTEEERSILADGCLINYYRRDI